MWGKVVLVKGEDDDNEMEIASTVGPKVGGGTCILARLVDMW